MATKRVLGYGGGRQTVAYCVLIAQGKVPKPDHIVIADTGRENTSTWDYLEEVARPLLASVGLTVEVAPRSLSKVDLYAHNGDLLLPAYTATGKLTAFCSNEWKARVVTRYLRAQGVEEHISLIGFALDEKKRIKSTEGREFPLVDLMLTKADCIRIILDAGLPLPPPSSCWMCPNKANEEWRYERDNYPADFERACVLDEEIRAEDIEAGGSGVWLHHSRAPLREADLDAEDRRGPTRQCGLGLCMV
jgi:hypothetical protein